ncbi:MAG: preprotein translocase subunit SecG [Eubacterium sp.]|nr:preprotein translocase subunit SecG [Eubacterium sp.]
MLLTIARIAYIVICIALTIVVLMQEGKTSGLGALSGAADSYWTRNKGRSAEGILERLTQILGALFVILSVVLCTDWLK